MARQVSYLLDQAQSKLNVDDYEMALKILEMAASQYGNYEECLSAYGCLLAEVGQKEKAATVLENACSKFPNEGHEKYMYLGQLLDFEKAVSCFERGIGILEVKHQSEDNEDLRRDYANQISSALCSLAELHLDSENDLNVIDTHITPIIEKAKSYNNKNPEPMQVLASLRSEQGRLDESLSLMNESLAFWFQSKGDKSDDDETSDMDVIDDNLFQPSFEFRFEAAKILLNVDESTSRVVEILESLLEENDEAVHVYYMLAMAYTASSDFDSALDRIDLGMNLASKMDMPKDDPCVNGFLELKKEIEQKNQD